MDINTLPMPSDVPVLNARLAVDSLEVTLGTDQEGQPLLPLGTVTEFVAQEPHVLARVRFPEGRTVKVPISLLHCEGEPLFVLDETDVLDETAALPPQLASAPQSHLADAADLNVSTASASGELTVQEETTGQAHE